MPGTNLAALDLNLLVVLDALLTTQSVSRAAGLLNSTQPAVSRALARLRVWFDDPLLARTRRGMVPTPVALGLAAGVREALASVQRVVERRDSFDPKSSRRTFRLTMSEYPQLAVCGPLLSGTLARAPGISVEVLPWSLAFPDALESGALDLAVCPPSASAPGLRTAQLTRDKLVVMLRRDHPAAAGELTLARYAELRHLQSAPNGRAGSVLDDLLEQAGHPRRVVLRLPSAVTLPALVASSDACATVPERLATATAGPWGLVIRPLPIEAPTIGLDVYWHDRAHQDPGNVWLRAELRRLFARPNARDPRGVARIDLARRRKLTL